MKDLLELQAGQKVLAKGWVRTKRGNKEIAFIALNDGSTIKNIQVVVEKNEQNASLLAKVTTGACISVTGDLVESLGGGQRVEIKADSLEVLGECDPMRYPLQKKTLLLNTSGAWLTSEHVPTPSVQFSGFEARWHTPYISISTTRVSFISILPLSQNQTVKERDRCSQ